MFQPYPWGADPPLDDNLPPPRFPPDWESGSDPSVTRLPFESKRAKDMRGVRRLYLSDNSNDLSMSTLRSSASSASANRLKSSLRVRKAQVRSGKSSGTSPPLSELENCCYGRNRKIGILLSYCRSPRWLQQYVNMLCWGINTNCEVVYYFTLLSQTWKYWTWVATVAASRT